jgi:hypothetical protein
MVTETPLASWCWKSPPIFCEVSATEYKQQRYKISAKYNLSYLTKLYAYQIVQLYIATYTTEPAIK